MEMGVRGLRWSGRDSFTHSQFLQWKRVLLTIRAGSMGTGVGGFCANGRE